MINKKNDYSDLLDVLKYAYENYKFTKDGSVINSYGKEEKNNKLIINVKFSYLYCLAYKKMIISNGLKNNDSSILALTDYNTFNSFMNIFLNEYQIYSDICTGKVLYFPYQDLAAFILEDIIHKNLLFDYLNCELPNIFKKEKTKKKTLI